MRSRVVSRRTEASQPVQSEDQSLPQHYKKYDGGGLPMTTFQDQKPNGQRRVKRGFLKRLMKRWHKSDQQPLCGDLGTCPDLGLAPKCRSSVNMYLIASGVMALLIVTLVISWLWLALGDGPARQDRRFPLQVRIEGAKLSQIASMSTKPLDFPILVPGVASGRSEFRYQSPLDDYEALAATYVDYGGIDLFLMVENVSRVIYRDDWEDQGEVKDYSIRDDDMDMYYAFDDDYIRNVYRGYDDDQIKDTGLCRRVKWHRFQFPNCNTFHEMDSAVNFPRYLNYGAYRDVFVHTNHFLHENEPIIWKESIWEAEKNYTYDVYEFTRMDAIVGERLTSNDRIVDIYGFCGLSILSEYLPNGDIEQIVVPGDGFIKQEDLHDEDDVKPQNSLSVSAKLYLAIEMAESIAVLHEYPEGRIVHDDIQLSQFLYDANGFVKFNDFNRAEIMLWNEEKQEFCRYRNGEGSGNYRAPEEYWDKPLDEKIDVYSFGNNIYALLTGLWPFYEFNDDRVEEMQAKLRNGETPFVDPRYRTRSFAEGKLVEIMEACWAYKSIDRPDMQTVTARLREVADIVLGPERSGD